MSTTTLLIAILGTGISLAGLMIGLVAWLRADTRRMEDRVRTDMQSMESQLRADMQSMEDRIRADMQSMDNRLLAVEHSQAKLEGLLDGLREAIVARAAA